MMAPKVEITSHSDLSNLVEMRKEIKIDSVKCQIKVDWDDYPGSKFLPYKRPRLD